MVKCLVIFVIASMLTGSNGWPATTPPQGTAVDSAREADRSQAAIPPLKVKPDPDRPFIAVWQPPHLRVAIWNDGRTLFAKDPSRWSDELREGHISQERVAQLKADLRATDLFDLPGTCYLVPDGGMYSMIVDLGDKQQMLYWDEVVTPGYGINIAPKPHHLKFMACWKKVNQMALDVRPGTYVEVTDSFGRPPESWYMREAIQSE